MKTGMLWFDNDENRTLEEKLNHAVTRYIFKYGSSPNICYVHPSMLLGGYPALEGITVRGSNMVLPYHFWLGHEKNGRVEPAA